MTYTKFVEKSSCNKVTFIERTESEGEIGMNSVCTLSQDAFILNEIRVDPR